MSSLLPECLDSSAGESPFNKQHWKPSFQIFFWNFNYLPHSCYQSLAKKVDISKPSTDFIWRFYTLLLYHIKASESYLNTLHYFKSPIRSFHSYKPNLIASALIRDYIRCNQMKNTASYKSIMNIQIVQ